MKPAKNFLLFGIVLLLAGAGVIIGAFTMGMAGVAGHGPNVVGVFIGILVAIVGGALLLVGISRKLGNSDRRAMLEEQRLGKTDN